MNEEDKKTIAPKPLCKKCRVKIVHGSKFKESDPWMALEIASTLALVRKTLDSKNYLIKYGNDVTGINRIECLGCFSPDVVELIIETAKVDKDVSKIKAMSEV